MIYILFIAIIVISVRTYLNVKEKRLGYPKSHETTTDIIFLLLQKEELLALRCCRRINNCSLKKAKNIILNLKKQNDLF